MNREIATIWKVQVQMCGCIWLTTVFYQCCMLTWSYTLHETFGASFVTVLWSLRESYFQEVTSTINYDGWINIKFPTQLTDLYISLQHIHWIFFYAQIYLCEIKWMYGSKSVIKCAAWSCETQKQKTFIVIGGRLIFNLRSLSWTTTTTTK